MWYIKSNYFPVPYFFGRTWCRKYWILPCHIFSNTVLAAKKVPPPKTVCSSNGPRLSARTLCAIDGNQGSTYLFDSLSGNGVVKRRATRTGKLIHLGSCTPFDKQRHEFLFLVSALSGIKLLAELRFCVRLMGDFCVCAWQTRPTRSKVGPARPIHEQRGFAREVWYREREREQPILTQLAFSLKVGWKCCQSAGQLSAIICHPIPQTLPLEWANFGSFLLAPVKNM